MNIALLLSGGCGSRLGGDIPKQYLRVKGKMMIACTLETLAAHPAIDCIQIVAQKQWQEGITEEIDSIKDAKAKFKGFSQPGETRQLSILNGMEDIAHYAADEDWIFIHDAARPLLSQELIDRCFAAREGHDGVLPTLPMKDTIYYSEDGQSVTKLLDRTKYLAGQAPELFCFGKYLRANRALLPERILTVSGSTEPAILAGMDIALIPGEESNFKITTEADLQRFTIVSN